MKKTIAIWFMLGWCAVSLPASAQQDAEPPLLAGRIALVQGEVMVRSYDSNTVVPALLNWAVGPRQLITTSPNSAAEVRIGANTLRIGADSALEVAELDDRQLSLFLYFGSASATIVSPGLAHDFLLRTPQGRISLTGPAVFRVDTQRAGDITEVKSWQGVPRFDGSGVSVPVKPGQQIEVGPDSLRTQVAQADAFDNWSAQRDRELRASSASRYLSSDMTGYEELSRYGEWRTSTEYGMLWSPRGVGANWVPYRDGSWAWIAPWGWTWIDQAPWGYAPSHYGRWLWYGHRWCWAPGKRSERPVWAPAVVGWVDHAHGVAVGAPDRHHFRPELGWFPLGAREVYRPPYPVSGERLRLFNAGHIPRFRPDAPLPPPVPSRRDGPPAITTLPGVRPPEHGRPLPPSSRPLLTAMPAPVMATVPPASAPHAPPRPQVQPANPHPAVPVLSAPPRDAGPATHAMPPATTPQPWGPRRPAEPPASAGPGSRPAIPPAGAAQLNPPVNAPVNAPVVKPANPPVGTPPAAPTPMPAKPAIPPGAQTQFAPATMPVHAQRGAPAGASANAATNPAGNAAAAGGAPEPHRGPHVERAPDAAHVERHAAPVPPPAARPAPAPAAAAAAASATAPARPASAPVRPATKVGERTQNPE